MARTIRALHDYRGPLLPGCEEPWAQGERTSLAESHYRAVGDLLEYVARYGDLDGSVDEIRAAIPLLGSHRQATAQARLANALRAMPKDDAKFVRVARPAPERSSGGGGWDAARDFSSEFNPNGPWSYGWAWSEDGPMQPAPFGDRLWSGEVAVPLWRAAMYAYPCLVKNEGEEPFIYNELTLHPGDLMMHPGPVSQVAVLRWTAPKAGRFGVCLRLHPASPGATTGVYLRASHGLLWRHEYRPAILSEVEHRANVELASGEWVEVRVDDGGNDYVSDSTGIDLLIEPV